MFGNVVMGIEGRDFEHVLEQVKEAGAEIDTDLSAEDLKEVVSRYKAVVREKAGKDFPQDPREQLQMSIDAVFGSWNNDRAILYRKLNDIKGLLGTAVNVQAMVFGNMGDTSGTGVAFTRNPSTGENKLYGEFLINAQGEDVVAGIRTPQPIAELELKLCLKLIKSLQQYYRMDLKNIIKICKIWNLLFKKVDYFSYKQEMVKEQLKLL
jgi:pyruvate,orthophosphate dikinase